MPKSTKPRKSKVHNINKAQKKRLGYGIHRDNKEDYLVSKAAVQKNLWGLTSINDTEILKEISDHAQRSGGLITKWIDKPKGVVAKICDADDPEKVVYKFIPYTTESKENAA